MSLAVSLAMRWSARGEKIMQSTNWASEHSEALREYLAKGMSFSEIAKAINVRFKTAYSRNAAISRAKRMGLARPDRPQVSLKHWPKAAPKAQQPWLDKHASVVYPSSCGACPSSNARRRPGFAV